MRQSLVLSFLICFVSSLPSSLYASESIVIGLSADMSRSTAQSGEAIRRGALIAIEEINASGGVLGRPLSLNVSDHRGIPARGSDNIARFANDPNVVAVIGGLHTPVAMAEVTPVHAHGLVYLGPWAAGTRVVENGYKPNFVFRVSVRDEYAGQFLIDAAIKRGAKKPGMLLWNNAWGRSNEVAINAALRSHAMPPAPTAWFNNDPENVGEEIEKLYQAGADVMLLVANPSDGVRVIRAMAERPQEQRLPVISHWGITGGNFYDQVSDVINHVDLTFLQTYSFLEPTFPDKSHDFLKRYCSQFKDCGAESVFSPVGTAHAYDLVMLLTMAIKQTGNTDRMAIRNALESIPAYAGLVRSYSPPFSEDDHDALDRSDFSLAEYDHSGVIRPIKLE